MGFKSRSPILRIVQCGNHRHLPNFSCLLNLREKKSEKIHELIRYGLMFNSKVYNSLYMKVMKWCLIIEEFSGSPWNSPKYRPRKRRRHGRRQCAAEPLSNLDAILLKVSASICVGKKYGKKMTVMICHDHLRKSLERDYLRWFVKESNGIHSSFWAVE